MIPAPNGWVFNRRCARGRESRRQRPSAFSGKRTVVSENTRISEAKAPGCTYTDRDQLEAAMKRRLGLLLRETRRIVGRHARCAAAQARVVCRRGGRLHLSG